MKKVRKFAEDFSEEEKKNFIGLVNATTGGTGKKILSTVSV